MTRAERLAKQEEAARNDLQARQTRLARIQAQQRAEDRKALDLRRTAVGKLVEAAGLFVWDDATLAGLFACLATLREVPDPVRTLEGLLGTQVEVGFEGRNA